MAEIRITYNSDSIKNISELNGMKGKNLVANEIFANEEWLDADQDGDNAFDHKVSGVEFLNFAKHIDTNGDEKITDAEIENWRSSNKDVGNSAHKSFSDEEVVELFGMVIDQANAESGKNDAGFIYSASGNERNTGVFDSDPSSSNRISLTGRKTDALLESFDNSRVISSSSGDAPKYKLTIDSSRAIDTQDTKEEILKYDTSELSSKDTNTVNKTMKQLKSTNLVAQNIYAHEEWLDENENDGKATNKNVDGKISGAELASFAKHVDQNNDGKITYSEFDQWRSNNIDVGNSAHANFTYEQALEVFNSVKDK